MTKTILEQEVTIPIRGKKILRGTLVRSLKSNGKLVIFVHGLFGHQNDHIFFNGAPEFSKKRIDSYRFDLYPGYKGTRSFNTSSASLQASDLESVIEHFSKKYSDITIVAHSMGGYITLLWNATYKNSVKRFVLWDPSWEPKHTFGDLPFSKEIDAYVMKGKTDIIIKKSIVEESKKLPDIENLVKKIAVPLFIIGAIKGGKKIAEELYFNNATCPKKFIVFETDHCFSSKEIEKKLFKETISWINYTS
jgi:esterase/lipase